MPLTPAAPITLTGAQIAFWLGSGPAVEVPVTKVEVKKAADKTEVTGSTSVVFTGTGTGEVWKEYGQGPSGGSVSFEGYWRSSQTITPPTVLQGRTYPFVAYTRRPGWNNGADPGSGFVGYIFIDDNTLTLDPRAGAFDWKVSTTAQGAIADPA